MPEWWRPYYLDFVSRARQVLAATGARPTSFVRSAAKNREVGGAENSQHQTATALDVVPPPGRRNSEIVLIARRVGLVAIDERDHVHLQLFPAGVIPREVVRYLANLSESVG